jgi:hypothetical protein
MKTYLVISRFENEPATYTMNTEELKSFLNDSPGINFLKKVPSDISEFPTMSAFIIEGSVIIPTPKKTVVEWSF